MFAYLPALRIFNNENEPGPQEFGTDTALFQNHAYLQVCVMVGFWLPKSSPKACHLSLSHTLFFFWGPAYQRLMTG